MEGVFVSCSDVESLCQTEAVLQKCCAGNFLLLGKRAVNTSRPTPLAPCARQTKSGQLSWSLLLSIGVLTLLQLGGDHIAMRICQCEALVTGISRTGSVLSVL